MNQQLSAPPSEKLTEITGKTPSDTNSQSQTSPQFLLKCARFGFWHWDLTTGAFYFDAQTAGIAGYKENELPGVIEMRQNLIFNKDRLRVTRIMEDYLAGKTPSYTADFRLIRKDGTVIWVREKGAVTRRDSDGKPVNFSGVLHDIDAGENIIDLQGILEQNAVHNERLEADVSAARRKLNEFRRTYAAMFSANPYPAVLFDDKLELIYCNPVALEFFGFSSHIYFIAGFTDYMNSIHASTQNPNENLSFLERLKYVADNGDCSVDVDYELKDRNVSLRCVYRKIPYGDSFEICLYMIDLTEIKENQKKLVRQEQLLQAINLAAFVMMSQDYDDFDYVLNYSLEILGKYTSVDQISVWKSREYEDAVLASRIGVWNHERLQETEEGRRVANNIRSDIKLDMLVPDWKDYVQKGKSLNGHCVVPETPFARMMQRNGIRSILALPILIKGYFWGFISFFCYTRETVFSLIEEELLLSAGVLIAAAIDRNLIAQDLVKARDEAQASAVAKSAFLSRMSHELRTPLNAIIGMNSIALMSKEPMKKQYCLEQIDNSSKQLLAIINDILDMAKIEANKFEIEAQEFNFEKMLQNIYDVNRVKMDEKKQIFEKDWPTFEHKIIGDELRISQVLINLMSNAIKFTPEGGTISLNVASSESCGQVDLRLEVKDTGIGISQEQQSRLFNCFTQAGTGITREYGGTGLGLAICKEIIGLMGGRIWIESESGKGASFIFEITLGIGQIITDEKSEADDSLMPAGCWKGKTILVVEDVEINREIINTVLEETGAQMDNAANGSEALEMYTRNPGKYDLILMDIQMPIMDGLEASARIRAFESKIMSGILPQLPGTNNYLQVPIIAMTANAFSNDVQICLHSGMNGHLAKPIDIAELYKVINSYLCPKKI